MNYYSLTRSTILDVKWADLFPAGNPSFGDLHYNPHYELIVVSEGPVYLQVEDRKLTLRSGEALLLKPWATHRGWKSNEFASFFWVQFTAEPQLTEYSFSTIPSGGLNRIHDPSVELRTSKLEDVDRLLLPEQLLPANKYGLLTEFERLVREAKQPKGYFRYRLALILGGILERLADDALSLNHKDSSVPVSFLTYRNIVNFLNEAYQEEVTKERIERALDRKYEYISQVFKKYSGYTIVSYIQQLRVQRAKYLLTNTSHGLQHIAEDVGFGDPYYFSRIFKRVEGVSPSDYRENNKPRS